MPRIKRWFPISHGFNRDPEIRQLRQEYADWMGYVWQEMCAIGDLNDGVVKGTPDQIAESLAYISLRKRPSIASKVIRKSLTFMQVSGWIQVETDRVLILNHAKYHRIENANPVPPNLPDLPDLKDKKKRRPPIVPQGGTMLDGFNLFWTEYPKKVGKGAAEKAWLKIGPNNGLCETIIDAVKKQKSWTDWVKEGGQFIPHPATWLNQRRWEDEGKENQDGTGEHSKAWQSLKSWGKRSGVLNEE